MEWLIRHRIPYLQASLKESPVVEDMSNEIVDEGDGAAELAFTVRFCRHMFSGYEINAKTVQLFSKTITKTCKYDYDSHGFSLALPRSN